MTHVCAASTEVLEDFIRSRSETRWQKRTSKRRIGPPKKESLSNPSAVGRLAGLLWLNS